MQTMNILLLSNLLILLVLLIITLYSFLSKKKSDVISLNEVYLKISEEIRFAVAPKFVDMSHKVSDLVELGVEMWRMEQRAMKCLAGLPENQQIGLHNSLQKLKKYLTKCDIEIIDYTGQKFNEGFNLDVLSIEKNTEGSQSTVKETLEPTVMYKGQVVRKAKIVLLTA